MYLQGILVFSAFLDFTTLQLFFSLYSGLPSSLSPLVSKFVFWFCCTCFSRCLVSIRLPSIPPLLAPVKASFFSFFFSEEISLKKTFEYFPHFFAKTYVVVLTILCFLRKIIKILFIWSFDKLPYFGYRKWRWCQTSLVHAHCQSRVLPTTLEQCDLLLLKVSSQCSVVRRILSSVGPSDVIFQTNC